MKELRLNGFMVLDLFNASGGGKKKEDLLDGIDIYSELRSGTKAPWEKAAQNENGTVLDPTNPPFRSPGDGEDAGKQTDLTAPEYSYTPGSFGYGPFSYGDFSYKDQALLDAAKDKVTNFSYDPEADDSYRAYARQYTRNGDTAYRNAMARMASRTGGVASSYAVQAAQGAYNDYMQQLAEKVPELRELAYQKARNSYDLYNDEYNRALSQWNTDRNLAYNQYQDARDIAYKNWQMQESARQAAYDRNYNQKMSEYESTLAKQENPWYEKALNVAKEYSNPNSAARYLDEMVETGRLSAAEAEDILVGEMGYRMSDFYNSDGTWKNGPAVKGSSTANREDVERSLKLMKEMGKPTSELLGFIASARDSGKISNAEYGILFRQYDK